MNKQEVLETMGEDVETAMAFAEDGAFFTAAEILERAANLAREFQRARNAAMDAAIKGQSK